MNRSGFLVPASKFAFAGILSLSLVGNALTAELVSKGASVAVPNVVGQGVAQAALTLVSAHLEVGVVSERAAANVPPFQVLSQTPSAGTTVSRQTSVNLVIAKPTTVVVPNLVGDSLAIATQDIKAAMLTVGLIVKVASAKSAGTVLAQFPEGGCVVIAETPVSLEVSSGPPHVAVPNVVGTTQAAATAAITSAGLTLGTVTTQSSATVAAGLVISESPVAGTSVAAKSAVNLVVSSGAALVVVPNVVGATQAAATAAIASAGLTLGTVTTQSSATVAAGLVISESPAAGAQVAAGSSVAFVVSTGGPSVSTAIGSSVPAAASSLIQIFYSPTTTVPVGGAVPVQPDGTVTVLFAGPETGDPLLLGVGTTTGTLDANSTAVGLVRIALGLVYTPAPLTSASLISLIEGCAGYSQLYADVTSALSSGESPIDSAAVIQDTFTVVSQAVSSYQASTSAAATAAQVRAVVPTIKASAVNSTAATIKPNALSGAFCNAGQATSPTPINVTPPLPFPLEQVSCADEVYVNDLPGTDNVQVVNQSFESWAVTSSATGATVIVGPLQATSLQLLGYYGAGSGTPITLMGAAPSFILTLAQTDTTEISNAVNAYSALFLFVYSTLTDIYPDETTVACVQGAVAGVFSPSFGTLVTQASAATALAYFENTIPTTFTGWTSAVVSCVPAVTLTQLGYSVIARVWQVLNIAQSINTVTETAGQIFDHWGYKQQFQVCKNSGVVVPCTASPVGAWELIGMGSINVSLRLGCVKWPRMVG